MGAEQSSYEVDVLTDLYEWEIERFIQNQNFHIKTKEGKGFNVDTMEINGKNIHFVFKEAGALQ